MGEVNTGLALNYYEHHIGDYAEATAHLSFAEDAAYSRLLRKYYASEKPLPADISAVQRLVGARSREEKSAVSAMLKEFFFLTDEGWHNKRCDEELQRFHAKQAKARASAEARWNKPDANAMRTHTKTDANALPTQCEGNALQSPVSSLQTPVTKEEKRKNMAPAVPSEFDSIRESYPSRAGSQRWGDAEKAYLRHLKAGISHETILAGVKRYADFTRADQSFGTKYVQQAGTFLGDNKGFLEAWHPPPPKVRELSPVERVRLANGLGAKDERVVSEQSGRTGEGLGDIFGDVRHSPHEGLRRIGS